MYILHILLTKYMPGTVLGAEDSSELDEQGASWSLCSRIEKEK